MLWPVRMQYSMFEPVDIPSLKMLAISWARWHSGFTDPPLRVASPFLSEAGPAGGLEPGRPVGDGSTGSKPLGRRPTEPVPAQCLARVDAGTVGCVLGLCTGGSCAPGDADPHREFLREASRWERSGRCLLDTEEQGTAASGSLVSASPGFSGARPSNPRRVPLFIARLGSGPRGGRPGAGFGVYVLFFFLPC